MQNNRFEDEQIVFSQIEIYQWLLLGSFATESRAGRLRARPPPDCAPTHKTKTYTTTARAGSKRRLEGVMQI
jgi:hypothetical protein